MNRLAPIALLALVALLPLRAQAQLPAQAGQDAYGAIAEIVRLLEADANTDWSKVTLEALRQHLVDMNAVTLRSEVRQTAVPGGARFEVTGAGKDAASIRRMLVAHGPTLERLPAYAASVEEIPGGARLTVRAKQGGDAATEARIRGLGFIGLLTVGAHHSMHHLALARGEGMGHQH